MNNLTSSGEEPHVCGVQWEESSIPNMSVTSFSATIFFFFYSLFNSFSAETKKKNLLRVKEKAKKATKRVRCSGSNVFSVHTQHTNEYLALFLRDKKTLREM